MPSTRAHRLPDGAEELLSVILALRHIVKGAETRELSVIVRAAAREQRRGAIADLNRRIGGRHRRIVLRARKALHQINRIADDILVTDQDAATEGPAQLAGWRGDRLGDHVPLEVFMVRTQLTVLAIMSKPLAQQLDALALTQTRGRRAYPALWQLTWDLAVVLERNDGKLTKGTSGDLHRALVVLLEQGDDVDESDFTAYNDPVVDGVRSLRTKYPAGDFLFLPSTESLQPGDRTPYHRRLPIRAIIRSREPKN